ncbi:ATP-dependent DNA ligase [Paenibacillus sp. UNC451MF]|uniref:ATP-dependent DNA ligase n=1 Tax=Paenibacillus sp. UNC451MF TaxID=1449063 RepID=UPI00048DF60E|nr:hypothetical protein [Paenibacillus sp. UNC451MF]
MFISPMLADSRETPFSDQAYVFEPKVDGHRLILSRSGNETRLFTRDGLECTKQYPELHCVPIEGDVVLDGELCCTDPDSGAVDAGLAMERLQLKQKNRIQSFSTQRPVHYMIWDILFHKGRDVRHMPLVKRRALLESLLQENELFQLVPQTEARGEELFQSIIASSMQGMIAKHKGSHYVSRFSHDWIQIMNYQYVDVIISGYRKEALGWLACVEKDGTKRHVGIIESGITEQQKKAFDSFASKLASREDDQFVHINPEIRARVKSRGWTRHRMLRNPEFIDFIVKSPK